MDLNASDRQAWHGRQERSAAAGTSGMTAAHQQEQQAPPVARQGGDHSQSRCSRQGVSAMLVLTVLLLVGVSVADAAATQCRVTPPVCPSRSEALARRPVFEVETPQHVQVEAGPKPAHKQRKHRATPATATQQSPAGASFVPRMSRDAAVSLLVAMGSRKERLFVQDSPTLTSVAAQQGAPAQDMPQRVMPTVDLPAMSDAAQQALFSQLLDVLQGTSVSSSIVVGPAASGVPQEQQVTGAAATGVAPVVPVNVPRVPSAGCGAASGCGTLFLDNARLRVGVDAARGGAISFISSPVMPPEWANVNLVNTWDAGRLIQQSYYGCYDNTCWADRPWRWNPVQGGSWQNGPPKLLASSMGAASVTVASVPRNWGGQQLLDDVLMVTETELHPNVVKVRFTMRYTGDVPHPDAHQEVPAVFVNRRLNVLAMYSGEQPWSNGDLTFIMPGQTGEYYRPTERWAAYVDQDSGFGLGVYTPVASQLVAYRIGPEKSTAQSDVSYMAPLVTANIQPNTEFSYDAYIAVGRVDEMRSWFAEIASRVAPTNEAGSYKRPITPSTLQTPLQAPLQAPLAQQVPAAQQVAGGRATDAARLPRSVEKLVAYQPSAVQVSPTGSDAVGFARAVSTNRDVDIDSKVARPPPAGVKLTLKPAKKGAGAAAAQKPSTPADSKAQQPSKTQPPAAAAAAAAGAKPQRVPPRNARLGNVRREAGHAQAAVGAVGATSLEQQTERWSRPTITHIKRPAGSTVAVAAETQQVAQKPSTQQVTQPVQQQQQQPAPQQVAQPVQQQPPPTPQQSVPQPTKQQQWTLQLGEQQQQPAPQQAFPQPGKEQQQQQAPAPQQAVQQRPTTQQPVQQQQQQPAPKPQQQQQQQPQPQQPVTQQPQQPKQAPQQPAPDQPTPQQQQQQPKPAVPAAMPLAERQAEPEPGRGLARVDPSEAAHSIKAHPGNYPLSDSHDHEHHGHTQATARAAEPQQQGYSHESPRDVAAGYPRGRPAVVEDLEQDWEWAHYQQQQQQQQQQVQQRRWEAEVEQAEEAERLSDGESHDDDSEHDRLSLQQDDEQQAEEQHAEERDGGQRGYEAEQQGTADEQEEYEYVEIEVEDTEAETEGDAGNRDREGEQEVEVEVQEEADADADADAEDEHAYRLRQMELRHRYEQQQREEEEQRQRQEAEARLQRAAPQAEPEPPLQDQPQSKQKEDKGDEWDPKKAAQKSKHDGKSKHTSSQHKQHTSATKDDKEHRHKHDDDDTSHKKRHVTVKHTVKPSVKHSDKHTGKHTARTYTTVRRTTQNKKSPSAALARLNIDDELRERIESLLHDDGEADARIKQAIKPRAGSARDHHDARKSDAPKRTEVRKWALAKALAARRVAAAKAHSGAQHKAKTSAGKSSKDAVSARIMSKQQAEQDVRAQMLKHDQKVLRKQQRYAEQMASKANRDATSKTSKGLVAVTTAGASDAADKKVSIWRSLSNSLQKMIEATTQALQPAVPPKNQLPKCGERSNTTTTSICV